MYARTIAGALLLCAAACGTGAKDQRDQQDRSGPGSAGSAGSAGAGGSAGSAGAAAAPQRPVGTKLPDRGPERPAYSLIDNRLAAHVERGGGLLVVAGSAGFAKYVRFGNALKKELPAWQLRAQEGGVPVARIAGTAASIYVPLTAQQAARPTIRVRVHAAKAGPLRLRVNGGEPIDAAAPAEPGWSTLDFPVPDGALKEGENALELAAAAPGAAIAWVHAGASAGADPDLAFYDPAQQALAIPSGGRMTWFVLPPAGARLTATIADAACAIRVRATSESGAVAEGTLAGTGSAVDLAPLAGTAARLDLEATGCPRAAIAGAALTVPGTAPSIERGEPPKHVVFLIMDSLRFDRVHAFEPAARAETPTFDRLAASSTLFVNHYVQGNESQVSHAAMWSSMYLAKHRSPRWQHKLPSSFTTLDEVGKRAGLYLAAATANGYIRPSRGYGNAWNQYVNHIEKSLGLRGDAIIDKGLSFLAARKAKPWLLYLGLIDTHVTWRAKEPWLERYDPGYKGRYAKAFGDEGPTGGFPTDLTDREKDHVRAIYDSNVSYQDEQLGKLIATLESWGVWDQTMLVITADHGDEQWEAGRVGHESGQDDTLLHVPLLVRYPPLFPAGRVAIGSEGIDILPTIADALGVPADEEWQGASLVPAAHGAVVYPGLVSSSGYEVEHGARLGGWKVRLAGTAAPNLYKLADDSHETKDVFGAASSVIGGRLVLDAMSLLRAQHAAWKKARWGNPANVTPQFAADAGE